jgi:hypothetical protein
MFCQFAQAMLSAFKSYVCRCLKAIVVDVKSGVGLILKVVFDDLYIYICVCCMCFTYIFTIVYVCVYIFCIYVFMFLRIW